MLVLDNHTDNGDENMAAKKGTTTVTELRKLLGATLKKDKAAAAKRLAQLEAEEARLDSVNLETTMFSVSIYDAYDGLDGHSGSGTTTGRGLAATVKQAERDYSERCGMKVRTDGALTYHVYVELPGETVALPMEMWHGYTCQPLASLKRAARNH